jgi:predicted DNA-binding transcriptional regulator AlpA
VEIGDVRLMGQTEIRERLGYSRQRVYILTGRRDFPAPRWTLAMGKVWWADDVEAWIRANRPELAEDIEGEG